MALEEKLIPAKKVVTLYRIDEQGHKIEHDSPCIGLWRDYDYYSKQHGIYRSKESAEKEQSRLILAKLKEGWALSKQGHGQLWKRAEDLSITVHSYTIDKKNLRKDGKGNWYHGETIII